MLPDRCKRSLAHSQHQRNILEINGEIKFERENYLLPESWIVIRIDGRGFHKFTKYYDFEKPNDLNALNLMNEAATAVMKRIPDAIIAYGDSDEYSFVLDKSTVLFERRECKLVSTFVSTFTACYQALWSKHFPKRPLSLEMLPTFDARAVVHPNTKSVKDYLSWRQVDCHINNLYNTSFWALVNKGGLTTQEAEQELCGTVSGEKNELLFSRFGINYNNEKEIYKKGTVLVRDWKSTSAAAVAVSDGQSARTGRNKHNHAAGSALDEQEKLEGNQAVPGEPNVSSHGLSKRQLDRLWARRMKAEIIQLHVDIIGDRFWEDHPELMQ